MNIIKYYWLTKQIYHIKPPFYFVKIKDKPKIHEELAGKILIAKYEERIGKNGKLFVSYYNEPILVTENNYTERITKIIKFCLLENTVNSDIEYVIYGNCRRKKPYNWKGYNQFALKSYSEIKIILDHIT